MPWIEGGAADLEALLQPHYTAHRVLIPRMLVWLDVRLFHAQSHLLMMLGWLSMLLLLSLQLVMSWSYFRARRAGLTVCLALMAVFLFSPAHLQNLLNPLNSSWHLSIALSMLAFSVLLHGHPELTVTRLSIAMLMLCLAAFTNFTGVIAWLLLPPLVILNRSRHFFWILVLSLGFVFTYVQGVSSDAEIAISMTAEMQKTSAVMEMEHDARALVSGNTIPKIAQKTLDLLAWPVSQTSSAWPRILVLLSLLGLAVTWVLVIRNWWLRRPRWNHWLEFCLWGATLCLGVAVSIQLGRLLAYPDTMHGPSPERYQTFIVCYWSYIVGLLVSLAMTCSDWRRPLILALTGLACALLVVPPAGTLGNELRSAEYASMLYLVGEQQDLQPRPRSIAAAFTPDYALAFDAFFLRHQGAYHAPVSPPTGTKGLPFCESIGLRINHVEQPEPLAAILAENADFQAVSTSLDGIQAMLTRHILLFNGQRIVGRLVPLHQGDFSASQLFHPGYYRWAGGYMKPLIREHWSTLSIEMLFGTRRNCKLLL